VWVNTALGATVRDAPSTAAARVGFLPQLTTGGADRVSTDSSGAEWYRVTASGVTGWVRGDLLVDQPVAYYDGAHYQIPGWSLLVPQAGFSGPPGEVDFFGGGAPWWRLTIRTAPTLAGLPTDLGVYVVSLHPEVYERTEPVTIWRYKTTKRVVQASVDICRWFPEIPAYRGNGWQYLTVIEFATRSHAYQFVFQTPDPDEPAVRQILDSINISQ
jgi:hypothetical protein